MRYLLMVLVAVGFLSARVADEAPRVWFDRLGYAYVLRDDALEKCSKEGDLLFSASFNVEGAPTEMDVTNPLMPLLFYRNTGQLLVLDNTLSKQHEGYDLFAQTGRNVEAVCNGTNGQFWLFDAARFELVRVDGQLRELGTTGPLMGVVSNLQIPDGMRVQGNHVYLWKRDVGFWVFDQFGTYRYFVPVEGFRGLGFEGEALRYHTNDAVYALDRFAPEDPILHQAQPAEKVLTVEGRWVATALGKKWQRVTITAGGN